MLPRKSSAAVSSPAGSTLPSTMIVKVPIVDAIVGFLPRFARSIVENRLALGRYQNIPGSPLAGPLIAGPSDPPQLELLHRRSLVRLFHARTFVCVRFFSSSFCFLRMQSSSRLLIAPYTRAFIQLARLGAASPNRDTCSPGYQESRRRAQSRCTRSHRRFFSRLFFGCRFFHSLRNNQKHLLLAGKPFLRGTLFLLGLSLRVFTSKKLDGVIY